MDTIYFAVKIGDHDVSDLLDSLQLQQVDRRANTATLSFVDSNLVLSDTWREGVSVEIDLGYTDAHAVLFRGLITGLRANFQSRGEPRVTVDATETLIKLRLISKERPPWQNKTVKQIVETIAKDNNLKPGEISSKFSAQIIKEDNPLHQAGQTDLHFLFQLAQDHSAELFIAHDKTGDTLNFVTIQNQKQKEPVKEILSFNANLESFSVSLETSQIVAQSRIVTTDLKTGERVEIVEDLVKPAEAKWKPDASLVARVGAGGDRISDLASQGSSEQAALYQLKMREVGAPSRPASDRSGISADRRGPKGQKGQGQARGSIQLRPCRRVKIEGCGGRWSGDDWYLTEVQHQLDIKRRNYVSSFTCER